ncbi:hypothetical protein H5J25_09610 [Sphingomonas aliaeris]|uniref:Putative DnaT-like domain-containing protein n=1 Tax=Sphingomonas aliaeris TaxID=2759526 RepID=A0A974NS33_9SPHN|nr:DnaT-like ssDNA-binding protein [Sphingomonas aliaeris]QQV75873.1 hypothetical protein H5J25_09610 [Sphingomonas aliaeris]
MSDNTTPFAVQAGINSYIGLADANTIAAGRLFATGWNASTDETRAKALATATASLDQMRWAGRPVAPTQPLAWPRVPERCPPGYPLSAPTPPEILTACVELAIHLIANGQQSSAPVQMRTIGDTSVMYFATIADELPKHVRRLIEPHLRVASAHVAEVML